MQFLGQHFLISKTVLGQIIAAAELTPADTVLEIGPGKGILTRALVERAGKVIAVEKDRELIKEVRQSFAHSPNVEIITADIRDFLAKSCQLKATSYKVVANIPYYLTSRLIRLLLEHDPQPRLIVLMIQREVAERIVAQPPRMNLLALSVQIYGTPEIITVVPQNAFQPQPKVESAIIRIRPHSKPLVGINEIDDFFRVARMGFGQKRKTLLNNFVQGLALPRDRALEVLKSAGIDSLRRAQTLTLKEWKRLTELIKV